MSTPDNDDDFQLAFSRTGFGTPVGKLEDRFTTYCDFETGMAYRKLSNQAVQTPSEALRDHIYLTVHKMTYAEYCLDEQKRKRQAVFGTGLIQTLKESES